MATEWVTCVLCANKNWSHGPVARLINSWRAVGDAPNLLKVHWRVRGIFSFCFSRGSLPHPRHPPSTYWPSSHSPAHPIIVPFTLEFSLALSRPDIAVQCHHLSSRGDEWTVITLTPVWAYMDTAPCNLIQSGKTSSHSSSSPARPMPRRLSDMICKLCVPPHSNFQRKSPTSPPCR